MDIDLKIIGITDRRYCGDSIIEAVKEAAKAGIKTVQFREKKLSDRDFYNEALALTALGKKMGIKIIINDRYDIALATDADGVHLGALDLPLTAVRKSFIGCIGKTVKSIEEAVKAEKEGASYVAIGPFYESNTKPQTELLQKDILPKIKRAISIPIIVIGGITSRNAQDLLKLGAYGIAVSESLFKGDVVENAKRLIAVTGRYGSY
ncbi:thiamine phosphate synthase [candidate division WOR-3 bacterium]|nr:thiamine phosphate synthase [candidate division WOR-3 bacterium]